MPRTAPEKNRIDVSYCDGSTSEETYLTDNWGDVSAMQRFRDFVKMGEENDRIWAHTPHVVKVHIYMPHDPTGTMENTEEFRCPCGEKKVLAGAGT